MHVPELYLAPGVITLVKNQ